VNSSIFQHAIVAIALLSMAACASSPTRDRPSALPEYTGSSASVNLSNPGLSEARLDQHIAALSQKHGVTIESLGDIGAEQVLLSDEGADLESALNAIAQPKGWTWFRFDDGSYGIASEEWYRANTLGPCMSPTKVFRPEHIRASELESPLRAMLSESGRMNYDGRTNKIIVVDSHDSIARIERFIREVDRPPPH